MNERKQLALDTDWQTATLAALSVLLSGAACAFRYKELLSGGTMPLPKVWQTAVLLVYLTLFLRQTASRELRIFLLVLAARIIFHIGAVVSNISIETWRSISRFEIWFDILFYGIACVYLFDWLRSKVRHV